MWQASCTIKQVGLLNNSLVVTDESGRNEGKIREERLMKRLNQRVSAKRDHLSFLSDFYIVSTPRT